MPNQCVRCKAVYEDGSSAILTGCACGSKYFFFFKRSDVKEEIKKLSTSQLVEIQHDVEEIIGPIKDHDRPVILDLESIRVTEPGKFEIDLTNLFKRKPVIYQLKEGKYIIDLASTFQIMKDPEQPVKAKKKKRKK